MGKTTIFITLVYVYMCVFLYHVFRIILVPTVIGKLDEPKICLFISFLRLERKLGVFVLPFICLHTLLSMSIIPVLDTKEQGLNEY